MRGGMLAAVRAAGTEGLSIDQVGSAVEKALGLDRTVPQGIDSKESHAADWLLDPTISSGRIDEAREVLRWVLSYRVWLEQRRSWRYTNPSLDKLGLVRTEYRGLAELINDDRKMATAPATLPSASPETRERVIRTVLDYLRQGSAVDTEKFDQSALERFRERAAPLLLPAWSIARDEAASPATWLTVDSPQQVRHANPADCFAVDTRRPWPRLRSARLWGDNRGWDEIGSHTPPS